MPLHGTPIERLRKIQRKKRCTHTHVSGRRCGIIAIKDQLFCGLHNEKARNACAECVSMMRTFTPPRGW